MPSVRPLTTPPSPSKFSPTGANFLPKNTRTRPMTSSLRSGHSVFRLLRAMSSSFTPDDWCLLFCCCCCFFFIPPVCTPPSLLSNSFNFGGMIIENSLRIFFTLCACPLSSPPPIISITASLISHQLSLKNHGPSTQLATVCTSSLPSPSLPNTQYSALLLVPIAYLSLPQSWLYTDPTVKILTPCWSVKGPILDIASAKYFVKVVRSSTLNPPLVKKTQGPILLALLGLCPFPLKFVTTSPSTSSPPLNLNSLFKPSSRLFTTLESQYPGGTSELSRLYLKALAILSALFKSDRPVELSFL
mmetsp:Transcript_26760/g.50713  ORF Transcript_26760/g.50713 Transcript_26760/m.50713 type:complete len:302 (+) Transcript_26760:1540-2445(+)